MLTFLRHPLWPCWTVHVSPFKLCCYTHRALSSFCVDFQCTLCIKLMFYLLFFRFIFACFCLYFVVRVETDRKGRGEREWGRHAVNVVCACMCITRWAASTPKGGLLKLKSFNSNYVSLGCTYGNGYWSCLNMLAPLFLLCLHVYLYSFIHPSFVFANGNVQLQEKKKYCELIVCSACL